MSVFQQITQLLSGTGPQRVRFDEPMSQHTTFRIGGPADVFVSPSSTEEIRQIVTLCRDSATPWTVVGKGSNILVSDLGIRGVVIEIADGFATFNLAQAPDGGIMMDAMAGARLSALAAAAARHRATGLEFASGIPGTLGGAILMNAGAYDGCMKDIVCETDSLTAQGQLEHRRGEEQQFTYRHSVYSETDDIIISARIRLRAGNYDQIVSRMADLSERRRSSQPLELPSAGSAFKRPPGYYAGKLIADAGLQGFQIGGAQVSTKHAGFIVNLGFATARDVADLIDTVKEQVFMMSGVIMQPEIKKIGEW
ncbi:MAG: UDP-N-acetylmuramate dehydrogenase [Clostridia bacterium]|nr:UDP-N-acetylmuramate dehydrogenase [Clostridia bacterium]